MSEQRVTTKADLIAHIERDWALTNEWLNSLSEAQWTTIKNPDGWTIKDHVAHLAVWERCVIGIFHGQPYHITLNIPELVFLSGNFDAMNAIIYQAHKDAPLEQVRAHFQATHNEVMQLLVPLTDADMHKTYSDYIPSKPGHHIPIIDIIYACTAHHYREHLGWMQEMLSTAG
ncbi:MAG: ClbS/DfsB family four-helix bundle protein [Chloroflexi bacterium]|nr:MAG: ClbS/DfsB family four-helix bundle protein [Chloroflexota bacterium]